MTTAREMIKAIIGRNKTEQSMLLILQNKHNVLLTKGTHFTRPYLMNKFDWNFDYSFFISEFRSFPSNGFSISKGSGKTMV